MVYILSTFRLNRRYNKAWYIQYKCSGIRIYGYADKEIIIPSRDYNWPRIEHIALIRKRLGKLALTFLSDHLVRVNIEE